MNIKTLLAVLAFVLLAATTATAQSAADSAAYTAINKKIQSVINTANAALDELLAAWDLDMACKLGEKSGEVCSRSKLTCERYVATYKTYDEAIAEVKKIIDASTGITDDERETLAVSYDIVSQMHTAVKEYIISIKCMSA